MNKKIVVIAITILTILAVLIVGFVFWLNSKEEDISFEDKNNSYSEGLLISLNTNENSVLIGESQIIIFWAKIETDEYKGIKSIPLKYYTDGTIFDYLYDDETHGDKIAGDGIYTNQFVMSSDIRECIEYYTEFNEEKSNLEFVTFYSPFTDEERQERVKIVNEVKTIISTYQYTGNSDIDYNNAVKTIENLSIYLENQIALGNVKKYNMDGVATSITLTNGMEFIVFFEFVPGYCSSPNEEKTNINKQSRIDIKLNDLKQQIVTLEPFHNQGNNFKFNELIMLLKK